MDGLALYGSELQGPRFNLGRRNWLCSTFGFSRFGRTPPPCCVTGGTGNGHVLVGGPAFGNRNLFLTVACFFFRGGAWSAVPSQGVVRDGLGKGVGDHRDAVAHWDMCFFHFLLKESEIQLFLHVNGTCELLNALVMAGVSILVNYPPRPQNCPGIIVLPARILISLTFVVLLGTKY